MMAINLMWTFTAVLLLTAQHCQTYDVQKVQGNNDNLLVHVISSMVKYTEKIKDLEHKLSRQQENHDDELEKIQDLENKLERQEKKHKDLDKMMIQLEEYAAEIRKIKSDHSDDIKKLQKNHDEELEKIANDINKIKNDRSDGIGKIRNDPADDIKKQAEDIKMLKASLSAKQPINPVVGFHVALTKRWSTPGKVRFDKILSNYGNGWNSIPHTYKVPTKGLHFLTLTIMNYDGWARSWLMHGTTRVAGAYAEGGHNYNVGTVVTVLMLDVGDHIYAQHEHGTLHSDSPYHYTYLAGFLIQKID